MNALQTAVYRGYVDLVEILMKKGAKFSLLEYKNGGGNFVLLNKSSLLDKL